MSLWCEEDFDIAGTSQTKSFSIWIANFYLETKANLWSFAECRANQTSYKLYYWARLLLHGPRLEMHARF